MSKAPPRPPAPRAPRPQTPSAPANTAPTNKDNGFEMSRGAQKTADKFVIYGPAGVGKTQLAAAIELLGKKVVFLDVADGSRDYDNVTRVDQITRNSTLDDIRSALQCDELWEGVDVIVIDDMSQIEQVALAWVLANVKTDKGTIAKNLESYGWGKGYRHTFDAVMRFLSDLDAHSRNGRHVVLICHDIKVEVLNPDGENYLRYEPHLQSALKGLADIRASVVRWATHVFFVNYDVYAEGGKGKGGTSRTIYADPMATFLAKSHTLHEAIEYVKDDAELWRRVFRDAEQSEK